MNLKKLSTTEEGMKAGRVLAIALKGLCNTLEDGTPNSGYSFYRGHVYSPLDDPETYLDCLACNEDGNFKIVRLAINLESMTLRYPHNSTVGPNRVVAFTNEKAICEDVYSLLVALGGLSRCGVASSVYFDFMSNSLDSRIGSVYLIEDIVERGKYHYFCFSANEHFYDDYQLADARGLDKTMAAKWSDIPRKINAVNKSVSANGLVMDDRAKAIVKDLLDHYGVQYF